MTLTSPTDLGPPILTTLAAVGNEPTAAYDIMRAFVLLGVFCLIWLVWTVLRAFWTVPKPPEDDSENVENER